MPRPKKPASRAADSSHFSDPDAIARRAYEIYQERGGRSGADLDDWLEAERQLNGKPGDVTGPAPAKPKRRKAAGGTGL